MPQLRCDLLDATADSAGLAAYACRDLGQHEWAQRHYLIAMQAAHAAGDHALAGHLVVRMAGHNIEPGQPKDVLTYLEAASEAIQRLTLALDLRGAEGARNAALDTISLAEAHLVDHDLGEALRAGRTAVHLAENSASRRVRKRLDELGHQLSSHRPGDLF